MNRRRFLKSASGLFVPITFGIACRSVAQQIWWNAVEANQAPPAAGGGGYNQPDILGWKCNEGSGTSVADSSSNGTPRACTLSASTFWGTTFTPGGSNVDLVFNGTSQNGVSAAAIAMAATNKLTVEFRINQSSFSTTTIQVYLDYASTASNTFIIYNDTNGNSGTILIKVYDNSGGANVGSFSIARPTAAAWHHIALAIDNSAAAAPVAYVDGSSVSVTTNGDTRNTFANFGNRVLTFASLAGGSLWAPASMKDVRIWNGLRTAGNIASDATNYP